MNFGYIKRMRDLREDSDKTQQQIADSMGISRSYVSRIEKKAVKKLAEAFKRENAE